ncbi:MAG: hypothetical protein H7X93_12505 [Sphingomonadaceae bacterium]|nr:hypothetical protein [Sphingomonadaceae bacterium]
METLRLLVHPRANGLSGKVNLPAFTAHLLGSLLLALAFAGAANAQSIEGAFFALHTAVGQIEARAAQQEGLITEERLTALHTRVARLQDAAASIAPADTAAYADSLMAQAQSLSESASVEDPTLALAQIADVEADLRIKDESRHALGLGGGLLGHVRVGIYTVRGNQRVSGLIVGASPVADRRADSRYRFPRLSSASAATVHELPPGRYRFTVEGGGRRFRAGRIDIGLQGQESITVDLAVQ